MTITRTQKKKAMQMFIREHFSDKLTEAGFVSYKGEDFHWYKYRDGLIYTIKMPIMRANLPLTLDVRFGVIPVFVWEHIAPECFSDKMGEVFIHPTKSALASGLNARKRVAVMKMPIMKTATCRSTAFLCIRRLSI